MSRLSPWIRQREHRADGIEADWSLRGGPLGPSRHDGRGSFESGADDAWPPPIPPALLEDPDAVPGYRLEERIGRRPGSWSVYRAQDLAASRPVALTLFGALLNHDQDFGRRLERVMPEVAALRHPHVLEVLDAGRAPRGLYIVTELEDAVALPTVLPEWGLDFEAAVRLLAPVADALDLAHARGLVHQGVAPDSILIARGGHALLTNFGVTDPVAATRASDAAVLAFLAPEVLKGGQATPRSDVYGFAATFLRTLTGVDPPVAHSLRSTTAEPRAGDEPGVGVPLELMDAIRRSLAADPSRRAPSAGALVSALVRAAPGAAVPITVREEPARAARRASAGASRPKAAGDRPVAGARAASSSRSPVRRQAERRRRRTVRRRRRAALGVAIAAVAAAAAGSLLMAQDADRVAPDRASGAIASTRELALNVPGSWSLAEDVSGIDGLPLDESMQLLPARGEREGGAALLAGLVREADDRLLPRGFARRLTTEPVPERVKVGRYAGYRYRGLELKGTGRRFTLYTVPTTEGVVTLVCLAQAGNRVFFRQCEAVTTTLRLSGLDVRPLGPPRAYVAAVDSTFRTLSARRRAGRARLAAARSSAEQAREADGLARAFAAAAEAQARLPRADDPGANRALVGRLRDVRDAYAGLARVARSGDPRDYRAAAAAVDRREDRLQASLERLRAASTPSGA